MTRHQDYQGKPEAILSYFYRVQRAHGDPPSLREIGAAVGISSPSVVKRMLEKMAQEGRLRAHPTCARRYYAPEPPAEPGRGRQIDLARLRAEFRAACHLAGVDPVQGPATTYEAVNAAAAARRIRQRRKRSFRWWQFDWSDPGLCRSDVEYEAFFTLFRKSWRFRGRWNR